jgi:hypothetical protein
VLGHRQAEHKGLDEIVGDLLGLHIAAPRRAAPDIDEVIAICLETKADPLSPEKRGCLGDRPAPTEIRDHGRNLSLGGIARRIALD